MSVNHPSGTVSGQLDILVWRSVQGIITEMVLFKTMKLDEAPQESDREERVPKTELWSYPKFLIKKMKKNQLNKLKRTISAADSELKQSGEGWQPNLSCIKS